jgi:transposase
MARKGVSPARARPFGFAPNSRTGGSWCCEPGYRKGLIMTIGCAAGIDAGKLWLDVGVAPSGRRFRVANASQGVEELVGRLRREGAERVVLEAVGPYARTAVNGLARAGFAVGLVNPRRIKGFREAEGRRAKTDRLDAGLIARFALQMSDTLRALPSAEQQSLKAFATRRRQLVEMIAMEKVRLKQAAEPLLLASHRAAIAALSAERDSIEAELAARVERDKKLARRYAILVSMPGIGSKVATTLITDLPELGTTDRRGIASLAGLAPHPSQSGLAPSRNQIAGGRPCVRAALYMAALAACRSSSRYKAEYHSMRDDGKAAKVAIIAVARKLLTLANSLIKADSLYDPTFLAKQTS